MTQESSPLEEFRALSRQLSDLRSALATLTWDQETTMPPGVAPSGPVRYRHWQVCTTNASSRTGTGT